MKDIYTSNREILNIKITFNCDTIDKNLAGIIDLKTKLLYITDLVYLFDMIKLKVISNLKIENQSALSAFNYCNDLIEIKLGFIYFIKYKSDNLKIVKEYKVCNTEIINISYDNEFIMNMIIIIFPLNLL